MKPRHLIAIVAIGTGLVIAPIAEKAEQAGKTEIARASFDGQTEMLEAASN